MFTCNSLSAANSFFFIVFFFLFAYQTYQQQYVAALLPIGSSLTLTDTYLYLYLETRADTVRRLLVLGFVFYKEYGSLRGENPWRRRIESKYM